MTANLQNLTHTTLSGGGGWLAALAPTPWPPPACGRGNIWDYRSTPAAMASSLRMRSLRSATSIRVAVEGGAASSEPRASSARLRSSQPFQPRRAGAAKMARPVRAAHAHVKEVGGGRDERRGGGKGG